MKNTVKIFLVVASVMVSYVTKAQNTLRPGLYHNNMSYYNPASGLEDSLYNHEIQVYGKHKLIDNVVWNKPTSLYGSYLGRLPSISSVLNVGYMFDPYSYFNRQILYLGYAYQLKFKSGKFISFGARGVFNFDQMKKDQMMQVDNSVIKDFYFTPDLDLGIQYQGTHIQTGIGGKNVLANHIDADGENLIQNQREIYAHFGYRFDLGANYSITPYTLFYYGRKMDTDIGLKGGFYDIIDIAFQFRLLELRNFYTLTANIYKGLGAGISADHSFVYSDINLNFYLRYRF